MCTSLVTPKGATCRNNGEQTIWPKEPFRWAIAGKRFPAFVNLNQDSRRFLNRHNAARAARFRHSPLSVSLYDKAVSLTRALATVTLAAVVSSPFFVQVTQATPRFAVA